MKKQRSKNQFGSTQKTLRRMMKEISFQKRMCYYFQRTLTWNLTHASQCSPSLPTNVLIGKSNQSLEYSQRTLESYDNSQRTHYYPFLICHQTLPLSSQLPNSLRNEWKHLKSILPDFSPWKKKS